jgi:uncharacterized membrane protein
MWRAIQPNFSWMAWNAVLALVPLGAALLLFGGGPARHRDHGRLWSLGVALFVAFLPNAPYVLTDIVHFPPDVRHATDRAVIFGLIPQYFTYFLVGFASYAACIALVRRHLAAVGRATWRLPVEFALHGLCAIGIYVGRFLRFNSWDLFLRPRLVASSLSDPDRFTAAVIGLTFLVLVAGMSVLRLAPAIRVDRPAAQ